MTASLNCGKILRPAISAMNIALSVTLSDSRPVTVKRVRSATSMMDEARLAKGPKNVAPMPMGLLVIPSRNMLRNSCTSNVGPICEGSISFQSSTVIDPTWLTICSKTPADITSSKDTSPTMGWSSSSSTPMSTAMSLAMSRAPKAFRPYSANDPAQILRVSLPVRAGFRPMAVSTSLWLKLMN